MTDAKDMWKSRHYIVLKLYLIISGIWPYHKPRIRYVRFAFWFAFGFTILIPQSLFLLILPITLDDIFECIPSIFVSILCSFKIASVMLNSNKVKLCFDIMQKDWLSLKTDTERAILQRHAEYGHYATLFFTVMMHTTVALFIVKPIMYTLMNDSALNVTTKSTIPSASKLPFHVEYGQYCNQYLYLIAIHCYGGIGGHCVSSIVVDGLYYTLIQHACGMFSVIGHMLENIGKNNDINFELNPDKIDDDNYNKTLNCLRRHLHIIQFAEFIEMIYTKIYLVSANINMIAGSLVGVQVLMNINKTTKDIVAPLTVYIAQLLHLFLHFWQAQFLLDYSVLPYESICRANWYYTSKRCQKLLLLIMDRAVKPCKITAGKIMTLSIESFAAVVKASVSYLTIFRSIQK